MIPNASGSMDLPVAIIGAGPIGLAMGSWLNRFGVGFIIIEAGAKPAAAVETWSHIRMFSPWKRNLDWASVELLKTESDWTPPEETAFPTGRRLIDAYLSPLSKTPTIRSRLKLNSKVVGIARHKTDRTRKTGRENLPFIVHFEDRVSNTRHSLLARAVIDASGSMQSPKPLSLDGYSLSGEIACAKYITYGAPSPAQLARIKGRVLVVGGGHTAMHALLSLVSRANAETPRSVAWAIKQDSHDLLLPTDGADRFPARLALHAKIKDLIARKAIEIIPDAKFEALRDAGGAADVISADGETKRFEHIVCATGYRPNHDMVRELQTAFDPAFEYPIGMRAAIESANGACAAVPPHGEKELRHPERDFYIIGMRSFGRASSFLLLAGYEQARTIAAKLAGDESKAAARPFMSMEETTLPEFLAVNPDYFAGAAA